MCTIHTFNGLCPDTKHRHLVQIEQDWTTNNDGGSVLLLDEHNQCYVRLQCTQLKHLLNVIKSSKASRYVVHLRASTTATTGVPGCHMFDSPTGQFIYCHNGIIPAGHKYRVDSMIVGDVLDAECGQTKEEYFLPIISHWDFANLIVLDTIADCLIVHKSYSGRLHHDGLGNWSTNRINSRYRSPDCDGWFNLFGESMLVYPERPPVTTYRYSVSQWYKEREQLIDRNELSDIAYDPLYHGESYCKDCGFADVLNEAGLCDLCSRYFDACNADDKTPTKENDNADSI